MNLAFLLQRAGRVDANRPALIHGTTVTATYGALCRDAAALAGVLGTRLGLAPGHVSAW